MKLPDIVISLLVIIVLAVFLLTRWFDNKFYPKPSAGHTNRYRSNRQASSTNATSVTGINSGKSLKAG